MSTHIEGADNLVEADANHAKEYFQVYRGDGYTLQRSDTMEDNVFTLDETFREKGEAPSFKYDDVALEPGTKVRRLTLKTHIPSHDVVYLTWPFINFNTKPGPPLTPPNLFGLGAPPKGAPKGPTKGPSKGGFRPPSVFVSKAPIFYVQYASDLGPTEAKIAGFQQKRDQQINRLAITVDRELAQLRGRMMWIGLSALGALLLGGYLVIRLGLAPLSKMSDAVSKVSARNFHLPLETKRLPDELLPIADRLVELLRHLEKAFAREKQAAADISHELRTPLAALMTTLEVGLKKPRSPDEYREILDECRASGQHMYQLVERLLTLARLDAGVDQYRPVETDVTEVALACADLIRPLARARGLALRLHLSEPITTETDPNKLREVLTNLLHNAVEYNKENGAIDLTVERDNGRIRFEVRDTGIGIKPAEREHLFERFYRADPSRHADTPHAGLGLAIVKSYVDLLGGTIKVESSEAGTAFTVELPYTASIHDIETAVRAGPALVQR
jgi:heavy metal sensor kinase